MEWTKISWHESRLIERLAEKQGMTLSEYLISICKKDLEEKKTHVR
jgi:hypothetical protein